MTFPVDDMLTGPDEFGPLHRLDMIIGHTGEEPAFARDYAVATARWQLTNPGSYNFRIYDAKSAGSRGGIMLNVPYLHASGGINPVGPAWQPGRYPWIERELAKSGPCPVAGCPGPYRQPTMHAGQLSFTGRTAQLNGGQAPANYVPDALRLIDFYDGLDIRGPAPLVLVMHGHLQTNRSDFGPWMWDRLTEDDMTRFSDVPDDHRFYADIEWLAAEGLTSGVAGTDEYRPEGFVTRGQQAAFMRRLARYIEDRARARQP